MANFLIRAQFYCLGIFLCGSWIYPLGSWFHFLNLPFFSIKKMAFFFFVTTEQFSQLSSFPQNLGAQSPKTIGRGSFCSTLSLLVQADCASAYIILFKTSWVSDGSC